MKLDKWQQDVLDTSGNIVLRSGRQVGKSTVISIKAAQFAVKHPQKTILIIASVERQALLLFEKTLSYLLEKHKNDIKRGKDRPTKHKIMLKNGSTIYSVPTGMSGYGIRGYTIDLLIADEAHFIPEEVWRAVTPMMAARFKTGARMILLSTPIGSEGYFYRCFKDDTFTTFHISSEECPRISKIFLTQEQKRMTKLQYAQEYLGEFIDELRQFFPKDLIRKCMVVKKDQRGGKGDRYMGVDVARLGKDDTVLLSVVLVHRDLLRQVEMEVVNHTYLTETVTRIKHADLKHNYSKIYIDDGGIGSGVFDPLLADDQTKRKVIAINNASRPIDNETRRKKILKEDLYNNLKNLMEKRCLELFDDPEILLSLSSIQYEYTDDKRLKIFGKYDHITEALTRAVWCMKDKGLNIYLY